MRARSIFVSAIVAVLVTETIVVSLTGIGPSKTLTVTETRTMSMTGPNPLYTVTFNETGSGCTAGYVYASRWFVRLDNITIVQPSNATLPFSNPNAGFDSERFSVISKIIFTVPNGTYPYYASIGPLNGTVTVDGSDVVVQVPGPYCI